MGIASLIALILFIVAAILAGMQRAWALCFIAGGLAVLLVPAVLGLLN
jgi:F0F1-type ATP synthase assembly protein I